MAERLTARAALAIIWRLYRGWAPSLLLLGLVVFVPVGLLNALADADFAVLEIDSSFEFLAAVTALAVVAVTALLGEVFYAGAVAVLLTHSAGDRGPTLREIASHIKYGRIVAIDLIYGVVVAIGLVLLIAPGIAAFVWLGLAAPLVELEGLGVREAFRRSVRLVRGRFWTVLAILAPIQLAGAALAGLGSRAAEGLFDHPLLSDWAVEVLTDLVTTPFYALAAVVVAVLLMREKEGRGPRLHSAPVRT